MILLYFLFINTKEIEFADSLFSLKEFQLAARHYQKLLFYKPKDISLAATKLKLAKSYLHFYPEKGIEILQKLKGDTSQVGLEAQFELASFYLKEGKYEEALLENEDLLIFSSKNKKLNLAAESLREEIKKAQSQASMFFPEFKKRVKNPELALLLSTFLPGSGEIYVGRYKEGIASFLVTGLCLGKAIYSLKKGKKGDAILSFSLFFRFYNGSRQNAYDFAVEYNDTLAKN